MDKHSISILNFIYELQLYSITTIIKVSFLDSIEIKLYNFLCVK